MLPAIKEPTNPVDKYAVCVMYGKKIVGHLGKRKKWMICEDDILLLESRSCKKQMHRYGRRKSSQSG